ncbi:MAG: glycosyltransferase family 4 protein [Acidobacteriia bacterium]|nr:glycosyltransferase family 4 protein [Terriglobia bacterium]
MRVILIAADWNNTGPVERQAITLAEGLARFEVKSLIISSQLRERKLNPELPVVIRNFPVHEKTAAYEIYRLPVRLMMTRKRLLFFYLRVFWILFKRLWGFDVIQGIQLHTNGGLAAKLARIFGKKCVIKVVSGGFSGDLALFSGMPMSSRLNQWVRTANAFVTLNDDVTRDLVRAGLPKIRMRKIIDGVDTGHFRPLGSHEAKRKSRRSLGLGDKRLVIFIGRLIEENNLDALMLAWQKVAAHISDARLIIMGDGVLRQPLESYVHQLGVDRALKFMGMPDDTAPYFQSADVFVYPARSIAVATSVLEAMSCGIPVVTSRIAGTADIMVENETGILCEPGDVRGLATALVYLLENEHDAESMGRAARLRIEKNFSIEAYARRYLGLYQKLIA